MENDHKKQFFKDLKEVKGLWGEHYLNKAFNSSLGAHRYKDDSTDGTSFLFSRIHIPSWYDNEIDELKTTEIDTLVVTQKGIFVCEVKSWSGKAGIFGEKDGQKWFQVKQSGERGGNTTGNPFRQNEHHIKYLAKFLGNNAKAAIHSIVLLTDASINGESRVKWMGDKVDGLFFNSAEVMDYCANLPYVIPSDTVREIAQNLSQLEQSS